MSEKCPSSLQIDYDSLLCLMLAANEFIDIYNTMRDKQANIGVVKLSDVQLSFADTPIQKILVDMGYVSAYPYAGVTLNCEPTPIIDGFRIPLFHVHLDLEPPYQAFYVQSSAYLDQEKNYAPERNVGHAPLFTDDDQLITHDDFVRLHLMPSMQVQLTPDDANQLLHVLEAPAETLRQGKLL